MVNGKVVFGKADRVDQYKADPGMQDTIKYIIERNPLVYDQYEYFLSDETKKELQHIVAGNEFNLFESDF
jgi:hypothetical protein